MKQSRARKRGHQDTEARCAYRGRKSAETGSPFNLAPLDEKQNVATRYVEHRGRPTANFFIHRSTSRDSITRVRARVSVCPANATTLRENRSRFDALSRPSPNFLSLGGRALSPPPRREIQCEEFYRESSRFWVRWGEARVRRGRGFPEGIDTIDSRLIFESCRCFGTQTEEEEEGGESGDLDVMALDMTSQAVAFKFGKSRDDCTDVFLQRGEYFMYWI